MRFSKWTKAVVAVLVAFSFSCTNLDEELFSQVTLEEFGQTEEEIASIVAAAYTGWPGAFMDPWSFSEVASDEAVVPTRAQDWFDNGNWQRIHLHQSGPPDDLPRNSWNSLFGAVNTVNRILASFEDSGQGDSAGAAELRGLRALVYFWLLDLYGNVPLQKSFADVDLDNGSVADYGQRGVVYQFLVDELEEVINVAGIPDNDKSRMNVWAMKMLLAKLYLNEAVYTNPPQAGSYIKASDAALTRVVQLTTDVIDNGPFQLADDYFVNFDASNLGSPENIMVIVYDQVFAGGMNVNMRTLHYTSQDTYNFTAQPWNGYCTLQEFYESFEKGEDKRLGEMEYDIPWDGGSFGSTIDRNTGKRAMFVVGPQFSSTGDPLTDDSQYDEPDGAPVIFTPVVNELGPNAWRQAGARIGKYVFEDGATDNMNNDYPVFRLADAYFMRAEANWQLGQDGTALNDLETVAAVRYESGTLPAGFTLDNGSSRLGNHLLGERGREFAFEYWRRNDLIRFGRYNDEWWGKDASTSGTGAGVGPNYGDAAAYAQVMPLPRSAIEANSGLQQNPGY